MGVLERKQREKEELKNLILHTATRMFIEEGYENASLRKIAEAIEYSPATIYLYYKNKDEIFFAIQEIAFEKFYQKLEEFSFIKDPLGRLRSIANSYLAFARENPGLYKLMFMMDEPMNFLENKGEWEQGRKCYAFIKKHITACVEQNLIKRMSHEEGTFIFWSFIHGLSSLSSAQRLQFYAKKDVMNDYYKTVIDKMIETLTPNYF